MQLKTRDGRVVFDHMTTKPPASEVPLTSPSVACFHPVLTLRYRMIVHDGPTPTAVVEKLAAEFRGAR
jgi:hypothetical protein